MVILSFTVALFIGYSALIIYYWLNWKSVPEFSPLTRGGNIRVSVIIAARNEAGNISFLLRSLLQQTYAPGLLEIIVVNDHSEDETFAVVQQFPNVILLNMSDEVGNSQKKNAIRQGIEVASGELIMVTDADCIPPPSWVETMVAYFQETHSLFIAAPVVLEDHSSFLGIFQSLDFLVLQGITAGSVHGRVHTMANGANLAYTRQVFSDVEGFKNIDSIASGDDMLLMHKIWNKFPSQVAYLKSQTAIVATQPAKSWREFLNQRIRWSSKAQFYRDKRIFWALMLVYFFNLSILVLLTAAFWQSFLWVYLLSLWLLKTAVEFPFIYSVTVYFKRQRLLKYFFFFQPIHILYTVVAGGLGQVKKYEWKGRVIR